LPLFVVSDTGEHVVSGWRRLVAVVDGASLARLDELVLGVGTEYRVAAVAGQREGHGHRPRSWFISVISAC
jgi:hypothetical protein